jgi:hypothetical protein
MGLVMKQDSEKPKVPRNPEREAQADEDAAQMIKNLQEAADQKAREQRFRDRLRQVREQFLAKHK